MLSSSRQISRPRRLLQFALSALGLLLSALLVLLVFLWKVPQSPEMLRNAVQQRLEKVTGSSVKFQGLPPRLLLPAGRLELRDVAFFSDGPSTAPAYRVGSIDVTMSPAAFLQGKPGAVQRITIGEPTRLSYSYSPEGIRPGPAARFLTSTLRHLQQTPVSAAQATELRIDDIEIALYEGAGGGVQMPGSAQEEHPAALLRGRLTASAASGGGTAAEFDGLVEAGGLHSTIRGTLSAHGPTSKTLLLTLGKVQLPLPYGGKSLLVTSEGETEMALAVGTIPDGYSVTTAARIPHLAISEQNGSGFHLEDQDVTLEFHGDYETSGGRLQIRDAKLGSRHAQAELRGLLTTTAPHPFDLQTTATRIAGAYRQLLERLLPPGYSLEAEPESFSLELAAAGSDRQLQSIAGNLQMTSVTLASPALPKPLQNLRGIVHFEPERIEFRSLSATTGRTRIQVGGELLGNYLRGEEALLNLQWKTSVSARDLAAILEREEPGPISAKPASGDIRGEGTLRQRVSLRAPASESAPPEIAGTIHFNNVTFSHKALPAPVQGLNGALRVQGDQVQIEKLSGALGGTPTEIRGVLRGNRYFWRDPVLSASVTTRLDLAALPDTVPAETRAQLAPYDLAGSAAARLQIQTPLLDLNQATLTGALTVKGLRAAIPVQDSSVEVRNGDVSASWDGTALILDRLSAQFNGEPFTASGLLSASQLSVKAKGTLELAAVQRTFPAISTWFELAGPATLDFTLNSGSEPAAPANAPGAGPVVPNHYLDGVRSSGSPAGSLPELLRSVPARLTEALRADSDAQLEGSILFGSSKAGARIRHHAMPGGPRVTESGNSIPEGELRNLRGKLVLRDRLLSTAKGAPLTCDLADTKDCTVAGTVELRPGNFPKMTLTASSRGTARFDTWLTGWGKMLPIPPDPPDTGRSFDLDFTFTAPEAVYKGQRAGRTRLELEYNLLQRPNAPRRTVFKSLEVAGIQGGRTLAEGELLSYVWRPNEFPQWNVQARFQQMPMLPLLTWIFEDVRNIDGFATGQLSVDGVKTDPLSIRGRGNTVMTDLRIDRTPLIQGLSRQTGRQFQGRYFSSVDTTDFTIADGAMASRNLNLDSGGGLLLEMRGRYFFSDSPRLRARKKTIDAVLRLKIFQSVLQQLPIVSSVPLVGQLASGVTALADEVAGAFLLAFQVSGPAEEPLITPVPLPVFQGAE